MINKDENPDFLNDFLDYSSTILNKSPNTMKEYNYDINHFLRFIKYKFNLAKMDDEFGLSNISINEYAYLFYLLQNEGYIDFYNDFFSEVHAGKGTGNRPHSSNRSAVLFRESYP